MREIGRPPRGEAGFTMVEVIVALVILTVGILALAGATGVIVRQINTADVATKRAQALETAIETVRVQDFDSIDAGSVTTGSYTVDWNSVSLTTTKVVQFVTTGPGMQNRVGYPPMLSGSVVDTFTYRVIRP